MFSKLSLLALFIFSCGLAAQMPNVRTISVTGSGVAKVQAAHLKISLELSAADESAPEALKKFTTKVRLLEKTVETLEVKNVKIERGTSRFGTKRADPNGMVVDMNGRGQEKAPEFEMSEKITLTLGDLEKMDAAARITTAATIADTLAQAGLLKKSNDNPYNYAVFGRAVTINGDYEEESDATPAELIAFDVADAKAAQLDAQKAAVLAAKKEAATLAELCGAKVGKVMSISLLGPRKQWTKTAGECTVSTTVNMTFELTD